MRTPGNGNSGPTKSTQRRGRGPWAESPCATLSRIRAFETRAPSTGSTSMFPGQLSMPLRTMPECVRLNASTAFMALPTRSPPPDASDSAVSDQAGDVLSVVHRFLHYDGLFAPCGAVWSASRTYPATQRRSGPVANAARCGVATRAPGRRVKAGNTCRGMPAFGQPFCAIVQDIVWDLPTSLPDSAARGDRKGPSVRNQQLVG